MFEELLHGGEGWRADVVFNALGIRPRGGRRNSEGFKKGDHGLVADLGFRREGASAGGEENGAVGSGGDETLALQPLDGADDGDVGDAELAGDVGGAGLAVFGDQIGDGFNVILGAFLRVGTAGLLLMRGGFAGLGGFRTGGHGGMMRIDW